MSEKHLRYLEFPVALAKRFQGIGVRALPVVEVSDEKNLVGVGRILTEHPAAVIAAVKAVVDVVVHRILEFSVPGNVPEGLPDVLMPCINCIFVGHEPWVCFVNLFHICG